MKILTLLFFISSSFHTYANESSYPTRLQIVNNYYNDYIKERSRLRDERAVLAAPFSKKETQIKEIQDYIDDQAKLSYNYFRSIHQIDDQGDLTAQERKAQIFAELTEYNHDLLDNGVIIWSGPGGTFWSGGNITIDIIKKNFISATTDRDDSILMRTGLWLVSSITGSMIATYATTLGEVASSLLIHTHNAWWIPVQATEATISQYRID